MMMIMSRVGATIDAVESLRSPSSSSETSEGEGESPEGVGVSVDVEGESPEGDGETPEDDGEGCAVVLEGAVMFMHYTSERAVPFVSTAWPPAHSVHVMNIQDVPMLDTPTHQELVTCEVRENGENS